MLEFGILGLLILTGFGAALIMAYKGTRKSNVAIDLEELATKVARAVAQELLQNLPADVLARRKQDLDLVEIDESIIPIAVDITTQETNLADKMEEEKVEDVSLGEKKSKLAKLLGRKNAD